MVLKADILDYPVIIFLKMQKRESGTTHLLHL